MKKPAGAVCSLLSSPAGFFVPKPSPASVKSLEHLASRYTADAATMPA
jgi:hypothetical protein